jgi:hypothetical protein
MREMKEKEMVRERIMKEMEHGIREIKEKKIFLGEDPAPKPNEALGVDMTEFAVMKRSRDGSLWSIKKEPYLGCVFKAKKRNGGEYFCKNCSIVMVRKNGRLFLK